MNKKQRQSWRLIAAFIVCTLSLVTLIVFQGAAAQGPAEPVSLKPPFVFQVDDRVSANSNFVPFSGTTVLSETFGNSFSFSPGITGTNPAWHGYNGSEATSPLYWNRVISQVSTNYQDTAWASCGVCNLGIGGRDPNTDVYVPGQATWLIYGPLNLSKYYAAEMSFNYLLDANPIPDASGTGDFLGIGVSTDGSHFYGAEYSGNLTPDALTDTLTLPLHWLTGTLTLAGTQPNVYLGFYFRSNGDSHVGRGAFIDNVTVRGAPYKQSYMPIFMNNFAVATPTPTSLYNFTFDSGLGGNDPNFKQWGGLFTSGNPPVYQQGLTVGNPGGAMYLYNTQTGLTTLAGPDLTTGSANYEISAQFRVIRAKTDARYGIVFGADAATFGKTGSGAPTFNPNTNYYKLGLMFGSVSPSYNGGPLAPNRYRLDRCDGSEVNCVKLVDNAALPASLATGDWDTLTVRREGPKITLVLNGTTLTTVTDGANGAKEFGAFIQSASNNNAVNPLEIYWDNYRVSQLP